MHEQEPHKEIIGKGELLFLWHLGTEELFSGYGLTVVDGRADKLVGLLMVDQPEPVSAEWWEQVGNTFDSYYLIAMKETGEQGIACQMQVETDIGIVHTCHAADDDIASFAGKPVWFQWQMIQMPTAPLIRLEMVIMDHPSNPYRFESFLNVGEADQVRILAKLGQQPQLHLAFFGDDLNYQYTKSINLNAQQGQHLNDVAEMALAYWQTLPPAQRDFDKAKATYLRQVL